MRAGSVFKRCGKCAARVTERRCPKCGSEAWSWFYIVDVAPKGAPREQRGKGGFKTKADAVVAMNQLQTEKASGTYVEPTKLTVAKHLDSWLAGLPAMKIRAWTLRGFTSAVNVHIKPAIGDVAIQSLSRAQLRSFYAGLARDGKRSRKPGSTARSPLSPKSIANIHVCLRIALNAAVSDGLLRVNPAAAVPGRRDPLTPKVDDPKHAIWTREQLAAFLASLEGDRDLALWRTAAYTGMRRSELAGLRWKDISWNLAQLKVSFQLGIELDANGERELVEPKSKKSKRAIQLDDTTLAILRDHDQAQAFERRRWGDGYRDLDLVFCRPDGHPYNPDALTAKFERAVKAAGLPRIRLHDLRHTHATLAIEAGADISDVSNRLGHTNAAFTARVYADATDRRGRNVTDKFAAYIEAAGSAAVIRAESATT